MPCLRLQSYFQVPSKTSCRKPLPSAAAGWSQATPDQATASAFRSPLLDPCLSMVFRVAPELDRGTTGYCCRLASQGMESLLALAFTPDGRPSPSWRQFLNQHANDIWACDLFTVQTLWFRTVYVFFFIHHGSRELIHAQITAHPNSEWLTQLRNVGYAPSVTNAWITCS